VLPPGDGRVTPPLLPGPSSFLIPLIPAGRLLIILGKVKFLYVPSLDSSLRRLRLSAGLWERKELSLRKKGLVIAGGS
jgi:hypothetical protein